MGDVTATTTLSRRGFLGTCGAALTLWPACLRAAGRRLPKLSFVVVSDTHLGRRDRGTAAERWERTAAELAKLPDQPVLHLGDIVDGGREAQYPEYLRIRKTIGKPVHEIPGNHDPQELFEKYVRRPVDTAVDHDWLRFVLLNDSRTDSHDGFVSDEQLEFIDRQCREATEKERYVALALHVPVHSNRHPDRGWYVKPENGQKGLYELVERHRDRLLCLMHGHFHNGIRGWVDHAPVHELTFPSALYNLDRKLEQQGAPGYNLPEFRPGYTLVTIEGGKLSLRYQPSGSDEFAEKELPAAQLVE